MLSTGFHTMLSVLPSNHVIPCNRSRSILTNSVQRLLLNFKDLNKAPSGTVNIAERHTLYFGVHTINVPRKPFALRDYLDL